jgi:hypothetical protein
MGKTNLKKILEHPDKDEIISKILLSISPEDINEWLTSKYSGINEKKLILSVQVLKNFQENYLDVYSFIQEDIAKTKLALANKTEDQIELAVKNNSTYKNRMLELAGKEIDVRSMIATLCEAVQDRLATVFDNLQENPDTINPRIDRLLIDYAETLGNILEKYYKFTEGPAVQTVNNTITLQVADKHITVFHDIIRKILSSMDLEASLYFMDLFHKEMAALKMPEKDFINTDMKLAETKLLSETINKKLNE